MFRVRQISTDQTPVVPDQDQKNFENLGPIRTVGPWIPGVRYGLNKILKREFHLKMNLEKNFAWVLAYWQYGIASYD